MVETQLIYFSLQAFKQETTHIYCVQTNSSLGTQAS